MLRVVHYLKIVIKIHQKTVSCEPSINLQSLENCALFAKKHILS